MMSFFFSCYGYHLDLHSFPTRRSSDLSQRDLLASTPSHPSATDRFSVCLLEILRVLADRSEEHTSELQSRQYLVCRLLLEKKKKSIRRTEISVGLQRKV